jgi:Holliday junction resolvase RusA-like endonuclease
MTAAATTPDGPSVALRRAGGSGKGILATSVTFSVPGKPGGKARPRLNRHTGQIYSPDAKGFQQKVSEYALGAGCQRIEVDVPVRLTVLVFRRMPRGWSTKRMGRSFHKGAPHTPDLVNIVAAVADGLTGIAYHDDRQVASIGSDHVWDDHDETSITVEPWEGW